MTFIDWHTLKIIGEAQGKNIFQFCAQYLYYIFEVVLVVLIIIYGQKAIETLLKKESLIPFGGIILAMTWGGFSFRIKRSRTRNMERNFYYDIFCS